MKFFRSYLIKMISLVVLLIGTIDIAQAEPNLSSSLKGFFGKIRTSSDFSIFDSNPDLGNPNFYTSGKNLGLIVRPAPRYTGGSGNGTFILPPPPPRGSVTRPRSSVDTHISALQNVDIQTTHPDVAYDPDNQRYLVVWEKRNADGSSSIFGQLRDKAGSLAGYPVLISTPRTKRGCFYENFDADNGAITTPANCPNASNPAVAYNKGPDGKGRYLVVWELRGAGDFAKNSDGSAYPQGKNFSNIIAKMLNASDLSPAAHPEDVTNKPPVWGEGILISGIWILSNNHAHAASNDGEIQAWEQSTSPDVAPSSSNGFLVTWQTNKGFAGCDDSSRRDSASIYARYIQPEFSPTNKTLNKNSFPVYTDPSSATSPSYTGACFVLPNVFKAAKPRITYNSMSKAAGTSDFLITYEFARAASAIRGDIGVQRLSLNSTNDGAVTNPTFTEYTAKAVTGVFFENPDIVSYKDHAALAYDDTSNISFKSLTFDLKELGSNSLSIGGNGPKTEPRLSAGSSAIALSFVNQTNLGLTVLDGNLNSIKPVVNVSSTGAQDSRLPELAGDLSNFIVTWAEANGGVETVKVYNFLSDVNNNSPFTPGLSQEPADGTTGAPTRLYFTWKPATDPDANSLGYEVYFSEVSSDPTVFPQPTLYRSNVKDLKFVIQSSTDVRPAFASNSGIPAIYLQANKSYAWKICAKDDRGAISICSDPRRFNTDDSVVGWWRFDANPITVCAAGLGKPGAPGGMAGQGVCDYSGNGNHGTVNGGVMWLPPMTTTLGGFLQFGGMNDYVLVGDKAPLEGMSKLTLEAWAQTTTATTNKALVTKFTTNPSSYALRTSSVNPGKASFATYTSSTVNTDSVNNINDGAWHHIVGTYDGALQSLFVDRGFESSTAQTGVIANSPEELCIGQFCNAGIIPGLGWDGTISEVVIYSTNLQKKAIVNKNCADLLISGATSLPMDCNL